MNFEHQSRSILVHSKISRSEYIPGVGYITGNERPDSLTIQQEDFEGRSSAYYSLMEILQSAEIETNRLTKFYLVK